MGEYNCMVDRTFQYLVHPTFLGSCPFASVDRWALKGEVVLSLSSVIDASISSTPLLGCYSMSYYSLMKWG